MSLNIGTSALRTAQLAINTIGHNLSNATTPGYSRQRINLSSIGSQFGTSSRFAGGVRAGSLQRLSDGILFRRVVDQERSVGYQSSTLSGLNEIESIFGEPGSSGLSARFNDFFSSLSSLSAAPDEASNRNAVLAHAGSLADRFRELSGSLDRLGSGSSQSIRGATREVNGIIAEISSINQQLTQSVGIPGSGHDLKDRQDLLLQELGSYGNLHHDRDQVGRLRVKLASQEVVSSTNYKEIEARFDVKGKPTLHLEGSSHRLDIRSGRLRGFLDSADGGKESERRDDVDEVAHNLIAEFNRIHSTGVPLAGGFESLRSSYALETSTGQAPGTRPLDELDLPFEILDGQLAITVIDEQTRAVTQTLIDVDPGETSLNTLLGEISAIEGVEARLDANNHLLIESNPGSVFHFGNVLDPNPDASGVFGSGSAVLGGDESEPFSFQAGDILNISVNGGLPTAVNLQTSSIADLSAATAQELADAINAVSSGATAQVVDGRVVLSSDVPGAGSTLAVTDQSGTAAATLGIPSAIANGTDLPVDVAVTGAFEGDENQTFTFEPVQSGTIGLTPGLQIRVLDQDQNLVSTLEVGEDYVPGDPIDIGNGVEVAFGSGEIEAGTGRFFHVEAVAEANSSDILVAFGLNSLFTGTNAQDIALNQDLDDNPLLFSQGVGTASSDSRNVLRMIGIREKSVESLGDVSIESKYDGIINRVGQDTARASASLETEQLVLQGLKNRLEEVRGVSIDEELLELEKFQQAYQAAARFIQAVNEVTDILFQI
ncbi:MAG: flagellar hook-associated protein FlgK [Planctomycetota bacterium]